MTTSENQPNKSEEDLLAELHREPVQWTKVDQEKLDAREPGTDFKGTLIEFDRTFQWIFRGPDHKVLIEKQTTENFTGVIHIKDEDLDPATYPNSEQIITFEDGEVKNYK